ncbi:Zinc finger protein castor-like protein 1, partial [Frankliniella fusca]
DEALWQRVAWRFAERCPHVGCELARTEHWHCRAEGCAVVLRAREAALEHARNHDAQDQVSEAHYVTVGGGGAAGKCHCDQDCPYQDKEKHYHCTWDNCREIILPTDKPFRRLDHYKMHEYSRKLSQSRDPLTTMHLASSIDAMFRRKRGRPPKNRVIEVWNDYMSGPAGSCMPDTPQAIFTSFKLPKPSPSAPAAVPAGPRQSPYRPGASPPAPDDDALNRSSSPNTLELLQEGFMLFEQGEGSRCGDALCSLSAGRHFHCKQPRCFYATDREDVLLMHARDFHDNIDILPGFVFFDRSIDCRLPGCPSNRTSRHFHCARPGCGYTFVRYSNMAQHEAKHRGEANNNNNQDADAKGDVGEVSPVGSTAGTLSPVMGSGPTTTTATPGTPRSRPPSNPHQLDQSRTTVVRASGTFYPLSAFSCSSGALGGGGGSGSKPLPPPGTGGPCVTPPAPKSSPPSPYPQTPNPAELERRHLFVADIVKTDPDASGPAGHSLAHLLQHVDAHVPGPPQQHTTLPEWMSPDRHVRYGPEQSCSRPFCKLKRKEHYHCNACNQAFSELERLRPHIAKHSTGALSPGTPLKREGAATPEDAGDHDAGEQPDPASGLPSPIMSDHSLGAAAAAAALGMPPPGALHAHGPPFPQHHFNAAMAAAVANQQLALMTSQGLPYLQHGIPAIYSSPSGLMFGVSPSGFGGPHPLTSNGLLDHRLDVPGLHQHLALKRAMSPHIMGGHQDMSPEAKKARIQNSMRILKDEPVPEGYIRFRFNEDCKYPHCGYREHQTHFHCMRKDCGYSFCDKTRFVQHTARHERLDTLMGGDFQQFRANVNCNRTDCVYTSNLGAMQNKASHFHCLKCEFVCTDTNKVVAHRRQHQKLDSIMAAGFEKFTPSQPCHSESCAHSGKQTHYHCLSCQYAVLGLSQMSAHKFRHME